MYNVNNEDKKKNGILTFSFLIAIEEIEVAPPKAHEVRIKILYTGV